MKSSQDPSDDKSSSAKSLHELVHLLLKLNAKLREKMSPRRKKESEARQTEIVILILNQPGDQPRRGRTAKAVKPESPERDWIENMFAEIEESDFKKRKNP
jgi:hypothetical protein